MGVDLVIKNAKIVLPDSIYEGSVAVDEGSIFEVVKDTKAPDADQVIDANGKHVLPGLIDCHVHFREPGAVSKEGWITGSKAAAAGGFTTVFDMPNTQPPTTSIDELNKKRKIAAEKSLVDYGFHFAATSENTEEIKKLDKNVASVKFYTSSTIGSLVIDNDAAVYEDFKILADKDMIATVHAENQEMLNYWIEELKEADSNDPFKYADVQRNICAADSLNSMVYLSKMAGNRLHVAHLSTKEEVQILRRFKDKRLTAEASPHHLFMTREDIKRLGTYSKVTPPLRSQADQNVLWEGIYDGTIEVIGSDHAPHLPESKERDIYTASAGFPELDTTLPLLLNKTQESRLDLNWIAKIAAENPARIFGVENKGMIAKGYDADLVIIDMQKEKKVNKAELFTKCGWSPYEGWSLKGWPVKTFVRGKLVFDQGIIHEENKGREVGFE